MRFIRREGKEKSKKGNTKLRSIFHETTTTTQPPGILFLFSPREEKIIRRKVIFVTVS